MKATISARPLGWAGRNTSFNFTQNIAQAAGREAEPPEGNLSVGMISVSASIDVTFALE